MKKYYKILLISTMIVLAAGMACGCGGADDGKQSGNDPGIMDGEVKTNVSTGGAKAFGYPAIEELPEKYTVDMAVQNSDYIDMHGEISNAEAMENFIDKVGQNQEAFIRTTTFTIEGDPVIIDFLYDGKQFTVAMDTTRDQFSADRSIESKTFQYLVQFDDKEAYTRYYIVTNEKEITKETVNRGFEGVTLKYEVYR